jgi:hypothetical protein
MVDPVRSSDRLRNRLDKQASVSSTIRWTENISPNEIRSRRRNKMKLNELGRMALTASALMLTSASLAHGQEESIGRGWPMAEQQGVPVVGAGVGGAFGGEAVAARDGAAPDGITALERDIFTSDDFYIDTELWSNPLYFRCNSPMGLESQWGAYGNAIIGPDAPASGAWGFCDRGYAREDIVSPYGFTTAQEHYEALLAETSAKGGPTVYTRADMPDWDGRYNDSSENWFWGRIIQASTIVSLLTPEFQKRFVQESYHHANTNAAQWPSQYCRPEGFLRRYHEHSVRDHQLLVTPNIVQWMTGVADNFITQIHLGRSFNMEGPVPRLGQDVSRWYGETIGFWDDESLITWTSNIQGWMTHGGFEHSNKMQSIEIYSPVKDESGAITGINHETVLYDEDALIEPVRMARVLERIGNLDGVEPYIFVECNQTIYEVDGIATPLTPGTEINFVVPDMFGRPWAQTWERYHEEGMQRPEGEGLFGF